MLPISFRDFSSYQDEDDYRYWNRNRAIPAMWVVINSKKKLGGPGEFENAMLAQCNKAIDALLEWREPITRVQRMNVQLYKGRHYMSQDEFSRLPYNRNKKYSKNNAKTVVNYLRQITEDDVADMCSYEPNLAVSPSNNEEKDKVAAKENKQVIDHYFYEEKINLKFQTLHRRRNIHGESFIFVDWNSDKGDYHPSYIKLRELRERMGYDPDTAVPLIDEESGQPIIGTDGEELFISDPVRVGDLQFDCEYSERVLYPHPESCLWEDVPWLFRLEWIDIDEVKARWPKAANLLKADGLFRRFLMYNGHNLTEKICVRTLYHPPSRFLDKGYYCKTTEAVFLEGGDYPYNHRFLPCIRATDIDVPGELTGMSKYQDLASLQYALNNSTSMILQNQSLLAYPKVQVPRAARVQYKELDDDRGIYEYSGPEGPKVVAMNSTAEDTWRWRDAMRDELKTLSASYVAGRDGTPEGITANVALRFIDEQQRKLKKSSLDKHSDNVVQLGRLILATLGTYRDPSDMALIKIIGKNNERYLKYFDTANLGRAYEVKLAKTSGLPNTPAAKTQTVLDISSSYPDMWSHDEVLEYLDIQRPEKLIESATVSRQAAESEVEDILQGLTNVPPPQPYHDLVPRYRVYSKACQGRNFDEAAPEVKQRMTNQIMALEYLMSLKIQKNPALAQLIMTGFPMFPMFFTQPQMMVPNTMNSPDMAMAAGMPPPGALGGVNPAAAGPDAPMPPGSPQITPTQPLPTQTPPMPQDVPEAPGGQLP